MGTAKIVFNRQVTIICRKKIIIEKSDNVCFKKIAKR